MTENAIDRTTFDALKETLGADCTSELTSVFLDETPALIDQINIAFRAGDTEAFRRAAHSLKSNAATFGATHLSQLARELELMAREDRLEAATGQLGALQAAYELVEKEIRVLAL